jgi:hypothetical protein
MWIGGKSQSGRDGYSHFNNLKLLFGAAGCGPAAKHDPLIGRRDQCGKRLVAAKAL